MTRKHLYEAATTMLTRTTRFKVLFPESLGLKARQKGWLQEGSRRRRQKAGGHSPRYVENKDPVPLERSCA
jgi:hypothetical protein